jgi:CubicO group peptidase (beta-lactamase class C family)
MPVRFLLGAVLALLARTALAASAPPDLPARLDEIAQTYVDNHQFMGTVLLARDETVVFTKSYGSADLEWNIPNSRTTKFRVGSLTKQFTAACILLLEERGKLKVDDPIRQYYPDAPAPWDKITLADLLHHTSGIHSYTNDPEFDVFTKLPATPEDLVKRVRDKPLGFEPGSRMNYSNTGYILLGMVIEKTSGMKYADFLKSNILDPLGMKDSGHDANAMLLPQRAAGYSRGASGTINAQYIDMTVPYSAGSLYSTVDDLLRWQRGLFGGKVLTNASLTKMITPAQKDYAYGVAVVKKPGGTVIRHGGGVPGFNAELAYFPESGYVIVALSNLNGPGTTGMVDKVAGLLLGEAAK